jgi:ribosomal protein L37AE/L43A
MQHVYTARDQMDAHFLKGILEREGIVSVVQGEMLEGAWGTMPVSSESLPSIWVNEADVGKAQPIIAEYQSREVRNAKGVEAPPRATWKCPKCGEEVEEQFDTCWNCGTERPEGTNPNSESRKSEG